MRRFFVENLQTNHGNVIISGNEFHHLKDVLRLKKGAEIVIFDGKGREFIAAIETVNKKEAVAAISKSMDRASESPIEIIICQAIAKGEKMDMIIQKVSELGAARVIPFFASRTDVKNNNLNNEKKTRRWQRIAVEAAKQSGRTVIPQIEDPASFTEILNRYSGSGYLRAIASESEKNNRLKTIFKTEKPHAIVAMTGPEGGFTDEEAAAAVKSGFISVSMGPRILRAETAAISLAAIIQYELGDMG